MPLFIYIFVFFFFSVYFPNNYMGLLRICVEIANRGSMYLFMNVQHVRETQFQFQVCILLTLLEALVIRT